MQLWAPWHEAVHLLLVVVAIGRVTIQKWRKICLQREVIRPHGMEQLELEGINGEEQMPSGEVQDIVAGHHSHARASLIPEGWVQEPHEDLISQISPGQRPIAQPVAQGRLLVIFCGKQLLNPSHQEQEESRLHSEQERAKKQPFSVFPEHLVCSFGQIGKLSWWC